MKDIFDDMVESLDLLSKGQYGKLCYDSFKLKFKRIRGNDYGMFGGWFEEEGKNEIYIDSFNNKHRIWATSGNYIKVIIPDDNYDSFMDMEIEYNKTLEQGEICERRENEKFRRVLCEVYVFDYFNIFGIDELSNIRLFESGIPYQFTNSCKYWRKFFDYIVFQEKKDVLKKYGMVVRNPKNDYMGDVARSIKELITEKDKKYIEYKGLISWGWNNGYTLLIDFQKYLEFFYYNTELKEVLFEYRNDSIRRDEDFSLENALFKEPTAESFASLMFNKRVKMRKVIESVNYTYK